MTTSFEDQLRADLQFAATDPSLRAPDLDTVLGQGHRVVRRRRAMQIGSVAALVAVIAVGAAIPWGGNDDALPAGPPTVLTTTAVVNLQVSENSNPEKYYRVSFSPNGSRLVMTHQEVADGIIGPDLGSTLDVSGSVATGKPAWGPTSWWASSPRRPHSEPSSSALIMTSAGAAGTSNRSPEPISAPSRPTSRGRSSMRTLSPA